MQGDRYPGNFAEQRSLGDIRVAHKLSLNQDVL
jgi:hypothetical protein